jgi:DNA-binding NarL/FixJ family response regulator
VPPASGQEDRQQDAREERRAEGDERQEDERLAVTAKPTHSSLGYWLHVRMPPRNVDDGLVPAAEIRRTLPDVGVLVLSQHLEPSHMLELVGENAAGVGYLLKDRVRDIAEFLGAVERLAGGGTAFDPEVVKTLVGGHRRTSLDELTDREQTVLSLLAEGRSNQAIANTLFLSTRAVERQVQTIFQKLRLPDTEDDNRRVLAVLALLGR